EVREERFRLLRAGAQFLGRRQHAPLLQKAFVFTRARVGLDQLVELKPQPVGPLRALRLVRIELCACLFGRGERLERAYIVRPELTQRRVRIEKVQVQRRVKQADVLVLPTDVEQPAGGLLQLCGRGKGAIDPGATAPFTLDGAADDQLRTRARQSASRQPQVASRGIS